VRAIARSNLSINEKNPFDWILLTVLACSAGVAAKTARLAMTLLFLGYFFNAITLFFSLLTDSIWREYKQNSSYDNYSISTPKGGDGRGCG
jgi:hypothetical protein